MDLDDVEEEDGDDDDSDEDELSQGGHWSACPEMHRQRRSGRRRLHSWSLVAHTVPPEGTHCTTSNVPPYHQMGPIPL